MIASRHPILTIGHSTHPLDGFIALLKQHEVTALADVRSAPYSRFNPQFNREPLEQGLKSAGIAYAYLGRELGGRSDDPSCFLNGRVQYDRLAQTEYFRSGIERVLRGSRDHRIALMCAEKEPLDCHRTLLVARALAELGVEVQHILADGHLEPHDVAMERLLRLHGLSNPELFSRTRDERVAEAVALQASKVAYAQQGIVADAESEAT